MNSASAGDLLRFIRQGRSFSGHETNCCFLNLGEARFADVSAASHLDWDDDGRAVGRVDWDLDGDLDLWVTNRNGPQVRFLHNRLTSQNHFIAFRLQGTACNRDAIGARVQLIHNREESKGTAIRTLRAGDGYLAQSSKWLHFGLGDRPTIERVVVHWPDGTSDEYTGIMADKRYLLQQGAEQATLVATQPATIASATDAAVKAKQPAAEVAVLTMSQLPVPRLPYRSSAGKAADVFRPGSGKSVLLNLWATWCQPCLVELEEITRRQQELTDAGIDVVALNVDGLHETENSRDPNELLQAIGFPFRTGVADARLVEKMQILNNHMFDLHLPLPVPTSALIDGQGQLVAWYRGPVSVDRVLSDIKSADLEVVQRRRQGTPFAGRWFEPLNRIPLVPVLDALTSAGFLLEADDYARRMQGVPKQRLLPALVRLGVAFYHQGAGDKAQEHFRVAVRIDPKFEGVETALGQIRERERRPDSAIKLYEVALQRNPESVRALNNLAWLLATYPDDGLRDGKRAVELSKQAVKLTEAKDPDLLDTLAAALAENGDYSAALSASARALAICRQQGKMPLAAKIETRRRLYEQGQAFHRSL